MDKFEEYIKKNRDSLDIREPSAEVWDRIGKDINSIRRPVRRWLSVAASVIVITGISLIFYQLGRNSVNSRMMSAEGDLTARQQLKEAEAFYTSQINNLYHEAEPLLTANPDLQDELNSDIAQIDSIYADLRKDLKDNIANQEVVEALIRNYTTKIKILEDMLAILRENENNGEKNKSHEL
jgi:hypothetical protein